MARRGLFYLLCAFLLYSAVFSSSVKQQAGLVPLNSQELKNYIVSPRLATEDLCNVRHDFGPYWAVDHWLLGNELYKSYQDPSLTCDSPYPFTVDRVFFVMQVQTACNMNVAIDIESVDWTNPSCPAPGALLTLSSTYGVTFPSAGLYEIEIPLDSQVTVNEPYFAGFFFASQIDTSWGAALVTDSLGALCSSYNIWDTTIGYIDLNNNDYYNFPGRLVFYTAGYPGGSGGIQPAPSITILTPSDGEQVSGDLTIWAAETSGSDIIHSVHFEYKSFGGWHDIGYDYDGSSPLRNGTDPSGTGDGWAIDWDYTSLPEDTYWIKATVFDTLGRTAVDSIPVEIDPTPPNPTITAPAMLSEVCHPIDITVSSDDENISNVRFFRKNASVDYSIPVTTLSQAPFGSIFCGPTAGAIAIKYLFDQGFIYIMREGTSYLALDTVVSRLADNMLTESNNGTYDDLFYSGMLQYIITHGNELRMGIHRNPDYEAIRILFQEEEKLVIMGLSGTPGLYFVVAGVSGIGDESGEYDLSVSNPLTGTVDKIKMRDAVSGSEVYYDGAWRTVDITFTIWGYNKNVTRQLLGSDNEPGDGLAYTWSSSDLMSDSVYFIDAEVNDSTGRSEIVKTLFKFKCTTAYTKGDMDGNGYTDVIDALYLVDYIYKSGPAPVGGDARADINCDNLIDINDAVFLIRYLFEGGKEPCF